MGRPYVAREAVACKALAIKHRTLTHRCRPRTTILSRLCSGQCAKRYAKLDHARPRLMR
ncbi:MAG: hypothetical protein E5V92_03255 [Mesorhizobium sp.]|nr:hypothetical protein EJ067_11455 [Mesorhizobium sp. M1D.F.Ca.ET.043.01.1.1]RWA89076.1 MAG: hypothetical protein EOQ32_21520 [Mesorhizobium sp.]RWE12532.1 MAG: hypothetical protein EOS61_14620 [Mesorhizobium sp.]TJW89620.1 MAG: hypothetical protein E5V92_03255 [Mesorhizobium sp.]